MGNRLTCFGCPVLTCFDMIDGPCGNLIEINHFESDVRQSGLLFDEIAAPESEETLGFDNVFVLIVGGQYDE